eukprot:122202_1
MNLCTSHTNGGFVADPLMSMCLSIRNAISTMIMDLESDLSTSTIHEFSKTLSPSKAILQQHKKKLLGWDNFIEEQQKELKTKKDSLQTLEIKLAKIALNNINDKCQKVQQWETQKRQQFDKERRRINLRTQRLEQQQMDLSNHKITMEMKYKTKLLRVEQNKKHIQKQQND